MYICRVRTGEEESIEKISNHADKVTGKGDLLLSAILRSSQSQANPHPNNTPPFMRKLDPNTIKHPDSITTSTLTNTYSKKFPQHFEIENCDKGKENKAILSSNVTDRKTQDRRASPLSEQTMFGKRSESKVDPVCLWKPMDSLNAEEVKSLTSLGSTNRLCSAVDMFRTKECLNKDNVNKCQEEQKTGLVEGLKSLDLNKRLEVSSSINSQ